MKKVRYGVIGIKGVGRLHIAAAQKNPQTELTALVDINDALVNKKSQELSVRAFVDYRHMLDAGIVDAVSIATPHYLLAPIALDCLNAGVHVLVEKPFAIRISEADAVIRIANAKGLKVCVGYIQRTFRASIAMKQLLEGGAIGNLMRVLWTWQEFRPQSYYAPDPWRGTFREAGGGVLLSQASHQLDLICWMIGKPIRVSALIGNQLHNSEIEDIVSANVLFDNGALGSLQFAINQARGYSVRQLAGDKGLIVIQDLKSLAEDENDEKILLGLYGENLRKSVSELPGDWDQPAVSWRTLKLSASSPLRDFLAKLSGDHLASQVLKKGRTLLERIGLPTKDQGPIGFSLMMDSFIDAILNGGEPIASGESARASVELINGLFISAMRKKTVDLPIDPEEYDCLAEELSDGRTRVPMLHQF
jgi:UDP-N-acetyl-2-amino-2-deoxyglucuronate dehydrogenase